MRAGRPFRDKRSLDLDGTRVRTLAFDASITALPEEQPQFRMPAALRW